MRLCSTNWATPAGQLSFILKPTWPRSSVGFNICWYKICVGCKACLHFSQNQKNPANLYYLRIFPLLIDHIFAQLKRIDLTVFSLSWLLSFANLCIWLFSCLFLIAVADKLEKSEGIPVEKVRLTERPENLSSNNEILDWDIYQYYKFLAERGDVQIQVKYTNKLEF